MVVNSIKINNILSIENAHIAFSSSGLTLIEGWNYDNDRSNGAGKTAIFNALSFALYGKMPRGITASEILRKGTKAGFVEVDVTIGDVLYRVHRARPTQLVFTKNDEVIKIQQEEFEALLGFSYDQFLLCAYSAQGTATRFISLNDSDKKSFILRLLNIDKFVQCKKIAEEKASAIASDIDSKTSRVAELKARVAAYSESTKDISSYTDKIADLETQVKSDLSKINTLAAVQAPAFEEYASNIERLNVALKHVESIKADAMLLRNRATLLSNEEDSLLSKLSSDGVQECPKCGDDLIVVGDQIKLPHDTSAFHSRLEAVRADKKKFADAIAVLDKTISSEQDILVELDNIKKDKIDKSFDYRQAQADMATLKQSAKHKMSLIELLRAELTKQEDYQKKIVELSDTIDSLASEARLLQQDLVLYQSVSSIFSSTGAQAYVLDSVVDTFNKLVSDHVSSIWPNATYAISTAKENKDGGIVAKLADQLTIDGDQRSIGSLSGGERKALSIAVDLAIIELIDKHFSMTANPIVFDEPFDGLDSAGREIVVELLMKLAVNHQVVVIDHMSESNSSFAKVIKVEKRNGISSII